MGFTKQDLKKNFLLNLSKNLDFRINFVQSTDFDIVLFTEDEGVNIYGLVPILFYIVPRVLGKKEAAAEMSKIEEIWHILELARP